MKKEINYKNPCIRKCEYNDDNLCVACFRTKKEIFFWGDYSNEEKKEILIKTKKRRKEFK